MNKREIKYNIPYELYWEDGIEISKLRANLDSVEKLGATHIDINSIQSYGDCYVDINAYIIKM